MEKKAADVQVKYEAAITTPGGDRNAGVLPEIQLAGDARAARKAKKKIKIDRNVAYMTLMMQATAEAAAQEMNHA
jgi:hypothetical protein